MASLARIRVEEKDLASLAGEFDKILTWVAELNEVNTDDVPPLTSVVEAQLPMRKDVVTDGGHPEQVLANAPQAAAGFFVVPKVVE